MLVSAIIPTYNRRGTILRALESVMAQTHPSVEIIVVDDGSTDGTLDLLQEHEGQIRLIRQGNQGPSAARNRGIEASRGEVVAFLDSDDVWLPEKLERQVDVLSSGGDGIACCVCNASTIEPSGGNGTSFQVANLAEEPAVGIWPNPIGILATRFLLFNQVVAVRRAALDKAGWFREEYRLLEDYDLALRLSLQGAWAYIADPLVVKYNDTMGIGVSVAGDQLLQTHACIRVLKRFVAEDLGRSHPAYRRLSRTLSELRKDAELLERVGSGGFPAATMAGIQMRIHRCVRAIRRRIDGEAKAAAIQLPEMAGPLPSTTLEAAGSASRVAGLVGNTGFKRL